MRAKPLLWAAGATLLAGAVGTALLVRGADETPPPQGPLATDEPPAPRWACDAAVDCRTFDLGAHQTVDNVDLAFVDHHSPFDADAVFAGSWPLDQARAHTFAWTVRVPRDDVFPLRGALAALSRQWGTTAPDGALGWSATLRLRPPGAEGAPAPDHVFVPLRGDATLDGARAIAVVTWPPRDSHTPTVTVRVTPADATARVYPDMGAGDSFPWAGRRATVARVVQPEAPFVGWVEVALSPAPEAEHPR